MARINRLLVKAMILFGTILLLSHAIIVILTPDVDRHGRHPMITAIPPPRNNHEPGENIAPLQLQQQRQKRLRNRNVIIPQPITKRPIPTAKTISPYLANPLFKGKERLLTMLHEAHYFNDTAETFFQDDRKVENLAKALPPWKQVSDRLGGDEPFLHGLDRCEQFQAKVQPVDRLIGVAGLFATGTNLLASLLINNCQNNARVQADLGNGVRWQANWGKHSPARYRLENQLDTKLINENYLPVVTTRHPYSWMQSMCRQRYSTHWFHNAKAHCPNLVPNDIDRYWYNITTSRYGKETINRLYKDPWLRDNLLDTANFTLDKEVVPVRVRYKSGTLFHDSLVHMWNEWYHEYIDADFPRIVVRLEDLVFHPKEVISKICHCAGGTVKDDFQYVTETAKVGGENIHGKAADRTNLFKWLTRFHLEDRLKNMTSEDHAFAREHLDSELLKMFGYLLPPPTDTQVRTQ